MQSQSHQTCCREQLGARRAICSSNWLRSAPMVAMSRPCRAQRALPLPLPCPPPARGKASTSGCSFPTPPPPLHRSPRASCSRLVSAAILVSALPSRGLNARQSLFASRWYVYSWAGELQREPGGWRGHLASRDVAACFPIPRRSKHVPTTEAWRQHCRRTAAASTAAAAAAVARRLGDVTPEWIPRPPAGFYIFAPLNGDHCALRAAP